MKDTRIYVYVKRGREVYRLSKSGWFYFLQDARGNANASLAEYARDSYLLTYELPESEIEGALIERLLNERYEKKT